ncbi:MAG: metallophosphoesterase [Nitrososphaeraceae archaeon]|nr:metallophosphoesterase [Nitrososphaeraceae archaeon]
MRKKILHSILILIGIAFIILYNDQYSFATNSSRTNDEYFNIITASDFGCSLRAQENINNIEKLDPELFLAVGDLSYQTTPDCWFDMTKSLDSNTKIAIGNHDDFEEEGTTGDKLKDKLMNHYGLNTSYYSFDYQNMHVLVLDSQLELSVDTLESNAKLTEKIGNKDKTKLDLKKQEPLLERFQTIPIKDLFEQQSVEIEIPKLKKYLDLNSLVPDIKVDNKQYQFVLDDLKKASQNKDIDWIIVMLHKPFYSPSSKQLEEFILREKYEKIFEKYGVDIVLHGHNHIYSRTFPLLFNDQDISLPIIESINGRNNTFNSSNGMIFLIVGTGGKELHRLTEKPDYVAYGYNEGFGFLNLKVFNNKIEGIFYDIGLVCDTIISEKKKETMDLESCQPRNENDKLKIIDYFTIKK